MELSFSEGRHLKYKNYQAHAVDDMIKSVVYSIFCTNKIHTKAFRISLLKT